MVWTDELWISIFIDSIFEGEWYCIFTCFLAVDKQVMILNFVMYFKSRCMCRKGTERWVLAYVLWCKNAFPHMKETVWVIRIYLICHICHVYVLILRALTGSSFASLYRSNVVDTLYFSFYLVLGRACWGTRSYHTFWCFHSACGAESSGAVYTEGDKFFSSCASIQ